MRKFVRTRPAAPAPLALLNGAGSGPTRAPHRATNSRCGGCNGVSGGGGEEGPALWEDPAFPASAAALGLRHAPPDLHWLRPHELSERPRFLGDEAVEADSRDTYHYHHRDEDYHDDRLAARWSGEVGEVGDASVCVAAAALAPTPRLMARVAPSHSFRRGYTGAFRFQFWVFGQWREVAVDDRLPARGARLLCSRGGLAHDYTLPLLEKAYAKLYGSYAALRAGCLARALQDLSGGVVQSFAPPRQAPALLLRVLSSALPRATLVVATAGLPHPEKGACGRRSRSGLTLVPGQAYCVTGVTGEVGSSGWRGARVRLRAAAPTSAPAPTSAHTPAPLSDVQFWVPFVEFARLFSGLELVHVGPEEWAREPALRSRRAWRAVAARRRWLAGHNAGGAPPARSAPANPQFRLLVPPPAPAHLVLALAQHYEPAAPRRPKGVGFALFELPPAAAARPTALSADEDAFQHYRPLEAAHAGRAREVAAFVLLAPGHYLLVPHARRPHAEGAFLLRVLCDTRVDVWEVNDDNIIIRDFNTENEEEGNPLPARVQAAISKAKKKRDSDEMDAWALQAAARACGGASLGVCRALLGLGGAGARAAWGKAPALLRLLLLWRAALQALAPRCGRLSSYRLRALLWAAGVSASNKVLEGIVLRFARRASLSADACLLAIARLHLAHDRYRSLDAKLKSNPLSLEEVILMTIHT